MSLVNDLLIEAERRRAIDCAPTAASLEDLVPTRARAPEASGVRRGLVGVGGVVGLAALSGLAVAGAAHLGSVVRLFDQGASTARVAPPSVAARPSSDSTPIETASQPTAARVERPVRVESVSLERLPGTTRIRIVADARAAHALEHDPAHGRLDLVLSNAALLEPTESIDLLDTPIRSLDLRAETPDLRLVLDLDREVHTQSRWLALGRGATLVLDLQTGDGAHRSDPLASIDAVSPGDPHDAAPAAIAPSSDEESMDSDPLFDSSEQRDADRVHSASLGDPSALRIEPSRRERERMERAERSSKRLGLLTSARRARNAGRLADADAQYAEIVLLAPSDPMPIAEWAEVLFELNRIPDALALLDSARESAPRDQTLLIAKARLLERTGDVDAAVELLDESGLALTEAPDVHALAAAYQQRAGRHAAAIERYEQILRRFPEEPRGWLGLGVSLEAIGRKREARDVYRIALTVGELAGGTRHWLTGRLAALGEEG